MLVKFVYLILILMVQRKLRKTHPSNLHTSYLLHLQGKRCARKMRRLFRGIDLFAIFQYLSQYLHLAISMKILEQRLRDRKTETEDAIQRRTANAQREVDFGTAHGNFDEVLINNNLEHASLRLRQILEEWYPHLNQIPASDLEL